MVTRKGSRTRATPRLRVNGQIRAPKVRVIGADNELIGVLSVEEALQAARSADLDLVEISPNADPPVCKVIDYGKYKYIEKKRQHEARKKQVVVQIKEVKFRPRTDEHDLAFKLKNMKRFLQEGNKAKVTIRFKGREIVYAEKANDLLARVAEELKDLAKVEKMPTRLGRTVSMVLTPIKK